MASSLEQVMGGLEVALRTIPDLRVAGYSPGQVNPPQAIIGVPAVSDYVGTLAGRPQATQGWTITILASASLDRIGQQWLARLADPAGEWSVPAAIAADRTLGGLVSDCQVASFEPLGLEDVGVIGYFGGRFTLRLLP